MSNTAQAVTNGQGYTMQGGFDNLRSVDITSNKKDVVVSEVTYKECKAGDLIGNSRYSMLINEVLLGGIMPHHSIKFGKVGRRIFIKEMCEGTHRVWHSEGTLIHTVKEK